MRKFIVLFFLLLQGCSPSDNPMPESENGGLGQTNPLQSASIPVAQTDKRPNILFIVADDLGFTDIGAFGGEIRTPNLDELAHKGLRLTNFHTGPACQPTRLMMMSGASADAANEPNANAYRGSQLGLHYATVAELLQDAGYATYIAGKWDLGDLPGYKPHERGFDRSFALLTGAASHFAKNYNGYFPFEEDGKKLNVDDVPGDFYTTRTFTDKMLDYLKSNGNEQPWFAYLPYTAPHWPLQLPDDWLDRYAGRYDAGYDALREARFASAMKAGVIPPGGTLDGFQSLVEPWADLSPLEQQRYARAREIYAGMVEYLDMSVGRVIDYLKESGQLENTVVIFTADHGASISESGVNTGRIMGLDNYRVAPETSDNSLENFGRPNSFINHGRGFGEAATAPFKDQKAALTEGGLRAAAFVYYPTAVAKDQVSNALITMMDILPTFLEIAGAEHPGAGPYRDGREIQDIMGRSAWPHLTGQAAEVHAPTESIGWTWIHGDEGGALIRGDYKIINTAPRGSPETTPWQLYNLATDPGERHDLAAEYPDLVAELVAEWEANWH